MKTNVEKGGDEAQFCRKRPIQGPEGRIHESKGGMCMVV